MWNKEGGKRTQYFSHPTRRSTSWPKTFWPTLFLPLQFLLLLPPDMPLRIPPVMEPRGVGGGKKSADGISPSFLLGNGGKMKGKISLSYLAHIVRNSVWPSFLFLENIFSRESMSSRLGRGDLTGKTPSSLFPPNQTTAEDRSLPLPLSHQKNRSQPTFSFPHTTSRHASRRASQYSTGLPIN